MLRLVSSGIKIYRFEVAQEGGKVDPAGPADVSTRLVLVVKGVAV